MSKRERLAWQILQAAYLLIFAAALMCMAGTAGLADLDKIEIKSLVIDMALYTVIATTAMVAIGIIDRFTDKEIKSGCNNR